MLSRRAAPVLFLCVMDGRADDRDANQSAQSERNIAIGCAGRSGAQAGDGEGCSQDKGDKLARHFVDLSIFRNVSPSWANRRCTRNNAAVLSDNRWPVLLWILNSRAAQAMFGA